MKKINRHVFAVLMASLISIASFGQNTTISGTVRSSATNEVVSAVSIVLKGTGAGTYTNDKGVFQLVTNKKPPYTLVVTSIGYAQQEVQVSDPSTPVQINLEPASSLGTEVVVSASRVPERILESPVSIERVGAASIRTTPATSYYDIVRTLKGVDVTTASLTFSSLTTRGFNGSGNARFNQFVDGMDNQAPGLNFSVGSVVGLTELDVNNMELLPGASSALYGSGGMNGTLLITSKNPFEYQGLSVQVKQGIMHVSQHDPVKTSPFYDWSFRWGKKISNKFAFKIGAQFVQAKDWLATDSTNSTGQGTDGKAIAGTRSTDPNYNGVNLYGDETSVNITGSTSNFLGGAAQQIIALNPAAAPAVQAILATDGARPFLVSRTGYREIEMINNTTVNAKLSGGLYYKITPSTEASFIVNYGTGNSVYTGSDRYSLKNLKIAQYKLEVKGSNWFVRTYTTRENSGDAYNSTIATQLFNEAWKPSYNAANAAGSWFPQYAGAYLQARLQGASAANANLIARNTADIGRPVPGTDQFNSLLGQVISVPIPRGGKFLDRTNLYQTEGQYNLTNAVKFAEVLVGLSWRRFVLNSQGTLFADSAGRINTNEYGTYVQIAKRILEDKLKLTGSIRYDKNDNFKGKLTPRFSAVYTVAPNQNIRASYQNAYRFPSNQNQWINLNTGAGILIGGLPQLRDYYKFSSNPVYTLASVTAFGASALSGTPNPSLLKVQNFGTYKPESANSVELGYKGLFNRTLLVDLYGYYSKYKDFIGRVSVVQSRNGSPAGLLTGAYTGYSVSVNSANTVNVYGFGLGVDYQIRNNLTASFNLSSDNLDNNDPAFATYFNTPKYRFNLGLSNSGFGFEKRFGFAVQYRWQDAFHTQADFKNGDVSAFSTLDGQISYKFPAIRSLVKLGATNLLNHYYQTLYGNPQIGGLYYVSFGYNVF
ncbi:MAG: TonB-dependent receptor [Williamsia sp.]|nr:TonB-dependent receptor [Williamsia sp.]